MNISEILVLAPILIISLSVHEFSHGLVAYWLGDDTAKRAGRLTLNPLSHLDIFGLIALFVIKIGWAKPVPINPYNFQNFKRDTALTAAAGPASNFIMAILFSIVFNGYMKMFNDSMIMGNTITLFIGRILFLTIFFNLALGLFNLIPFPPLDGSKILGGFLSDRVYFKYTAQERKGMIAFMAIMLLSYVLRIPIVSYIIMPPLNFLMKLLTGLTL